MDDRQRPAVEFLGEDASGFIAVEHTLIESFPEQTTAHQRLYKLFPLGGPVLEDVSDTPRFRVLLHANELLRVGYTDRRLVAPLVTEAVRRLLPDAPWPHIPGLPTFVRERIAELDLEISVEQWVDGIGFVGPSEHVAQVRFWAPKDLEARRRVRLQRALERKVPKLLAARPGARTILVLEDRDISMSAPAFVSRAAFEAAQRNLPSAIYLLNTTAGVYTVPLLLDGVRWHESQHRLLTFPTARAAQFNSVPP